LGAEFVVENYGVAATTAIKALPTAWASTPQMAEALASNPDVVLFWFGGNDSWADVWPEHGDEFKADYQSLVEEFQALPSHPKTILIRLWVFQDGPAQLDVLDQEILPMIDQIAVETNSTVIDYRTFITPHPEWFDDGMHANDTGTVFIGEFFAEQITTALAATNGGAGGAGGSTGSPQAGEGGAAGEPMSTGGLGGSGGSNGLVAPMAGAAGAAMAPAPAQGGSAGMPGTAGNAGTAGSSGNGGTATTAGGNSGSSNVDQESSCGISRSRNNDGSLAFWSLAVAALIRRRRVSRTP
jgi:hypothetical protein